MQSSFDSLKTVAPSPIDESDEEKISVDGSEVSKKSGDSGKQVGIRSFYGGNGNNIIRGVLMVLGKVQKYSTYVFTGFFLLHGINVLVAPAIDLNIAEEVLMMARDVYQKKLVETCILGSVVAHVVSGVTMRIIRRFQGLQIKRRDPKNRHLKAKSLNDQIQIEREIKYNATTNDYEIKNEAVGMGGWYSVFNLGLRKSLTFRKLGLTPLQFSGYLLVPTLLYHVMGERLAPLLVDGDSSLISLAYVSHAFARGNKYIMYPGFAALIYLSLYHITSGWLKYLKVFSIRKKNFWFLVVNGATALGLYSLYRITTLGLETGNVATAFDLYIAYFKW